MFILAVMYNELNDIMVLRVHIKASFSPTVVTVYTKISSGN